MKELLQRAIQINRELGAKLKELKELEEPNLLGADGKYFTAKIGNIKCKGRVRVEGGEAYLCQDSNKGDSCYDKLGYRYSWRVSNLTYNGVLDLKLWDYLPKEGEYFYVKSRSGFSYIAIAKNGEDLTSRFVSLNKDNGELNYNELGLVCPELDIKELRSATTEEITLLDTKLKENGQYFDQATMSIKDIVNEPAFKEGDWFIPKKPEDFYSRAVYWDFEMDKFNGKKLKIEAITTSGMLLSNDWKFHPDWCEKVEAPKSKPMVNKLKECFKNTPKAQVVKDWEATREFDKTPKPNKPKVGDLCIFWDNDKSEAIIGIMTDATLQYESLSSIQLSAFLQLHSFRISRAVFRIY